MLRNKHECVGHGRENDVMNMLGQKCTQEAITNTFTGSKGAW